MRKTTAYPEWTEGYDWLFERARELRGDLSAIRAIDPPEGSSQHWLSGFYTAQVTLANLLVPTRMTLDEHLVRHVPGEADAQAVEAFLEHGHLKTAAIRRGLFGDDS